MRIANTLFVLITLAAASASLPLSLGHTASCATASAPHTYGTSATTSLSNPAFSISASIGNVQVYDNNTGDCDGDGAPANFDGDYEAGLGGGFFGAGFWANEATCQYGLKTHDTTVTVTDVLSPNIAFWTAADDRDGPVVFLSDPTTGQNQCSTDGTISPGDPEIDPTADSDDCLSALFVNSGTACGTGGDGGYWVIILTSIDGTTIHSAPTTGFITA